MCNAYITYAISHWFNSTVNFTTCNVFLALVLLTHCWQDQCQKHQLMLEAPVLVAPVLEALLLVAPVLVTLVLVAPVVVDPVLKSIFLQPWCWQNIAFSTGKEIQYVLGMINQKWCEKQTLCITILIFKSIYTYCFVTN